MIQRRIASVPLITNDPYFSIWSGYDHLYDGETTHWAGQNKRMTGILELDGEFFCFMGKAKNQNIIEQTGLEITATSTIYTFENRKIRLTVKFTSPLLLADAELVSRPCSYIDFMVASVDSNAHDVKIHIDFDQEFTHDTVEATVCGGNFHTEEIGYAYMGRADQKPLCHSGDHITIDWGQFYAASPKAQRDKIAFNCREANLSSVSVCVEMDDVTKTQHKFIVVAYDDMASINYFGDIKKGYWTKFSENILVAIKKSVAEHDSIMKKCEALDCDIHDKAVESIDEDYALLCAVSYRHSISAHKLIEDNDGNLIFLSKENDSNGCIGTVDISYPSMALYLMYNTDYVKGMMRPVFKFASCDAWEYDFAPHDVGRYPYAVGQVYGLDCSKENSGFVRTRSSVLPSYYMFPKGSEIFDFNDQMPVEESGNMLVMMAVVCDIDGNADFAKPYFDTLQKWSNYLVKFGADPGEQLCTDDFAGHLAHNVNLSAKAIMGIESFARIAKMLGKTDIANEYFAKAKAMAADWEKRAVTGDHTMLTFDNPDSWSLKYNLVWDKFFGSKLFNESIYENEINWYIQKRNEFSVPLDSRCDYTKSDWILWCTVMTSCKEKRAALVDPIATYLEKTKTRVAFSDWYETISGNYCHFIARSVQGGIFMPLLFDSRK